MSKKNNNNNYVPVKVKGGSKRKSKNLLTTQKDANDQIHHNWLDHEIYHLV